MGSGERVVRVRIPDNERVWELVSLEASPCTLACPTRINVKGYVSLIADGRYEQAISLIRESNPFPGVCGRVCPRPCEAACRRAEFDEPIAICALKRFVFDMEMRRGTDPSEPARIFRKEKVAVIGAGPAGLSAAFALSRLGYPVTVFEAGDKPGGMMNVIPEFRLPSRVVDREVNAILAGGIGLETGKAFGRDVTWKGLKRQGYRALLLATGAQLPASKFGCLGGSGVVHSLDLLRTRKGMETAFKPRGEGLPELSLAGKRLIVAGDGMLALDTARTVARMGCRSVVIVMGRSRKLAPVRKEDLAAAREEGVRIAFLARPVRLLRSGRRLLGAECVRLKEAEPDATGRRGLFEREGSEFTIPADIVIDAYSRGVDIESLGKDFELEVTPGGTVAVKNDHMIAGPADVFAAGDLVTGPRSVVEAVASGQKAARGIHAYLSGEGVGSPFDIRGENAAARREFALERQPERPASRAAMPVEEARSRKRDFREVEKGLTEIDARFEARRCLRCGPCAECDVCTDICDKKQFELIVDDDLFATLHTGREFWSNEPERVLLELDEERAEGRVIRMACSVRQDMCVGCGRCESVCGYRAVRVESLPGGRFIADVNEIACKGCGNCVSVCPTGAMDQVNFGREDMHWALSAIQPSRTRVLFTCRWARPEKIDLPDDILVIETMCSGRLTPALILDAVERGSAGVMVCGCSIEGCHYGFGRESGSRVVERSRGILSILGFDPDILYEASCSPSNFHDVVYSWAGRNR